MIYLTSDLHLGHSNIIKHCNRPFENIEKMNEELIKNINNMVKQNDELFILGDFYYGDRHIQSIFEFAQKIKCKRIHLIRGNHETDLDELLEYNEKYKIFESISSYREINYEKRKIILCHFPFMDHSWNKAQHGSIDLHGHIHSSSRYNLEQKEKGILRYDVGVDANDYYPVLLDNILEFFKDVVINEEDYHRNHI